jgi:excisionase family DNA binding protein
MATQTLLTVRDVAEMLGLSVGGVYHLISAERIPVVRLSARCVRFDRLALEQWINEMAVPARSTEHARQRRK